MLEGLLLKFTQNLHTSVACSAQISQRKYNGAGILYAGVWRHERL